MSVLLYLVCCSHWLMFPHFRRSDMWTKLNGCFCVTGRTEFCLLSRCPWQGQELPWTSTQERRHAIPALLERCHQCALDATAGHAAKGCESHRPPLNPADHRESFEEVPNQVCCLYNTQFSKPISSFMWKSHSFTGLDQCWKKTVFIFMCDNDHKSMCLQTRTEVERDLQRPWCISHTATEGEYHRLHVSKGEGPRWPHPQSLHPLCRCGRGRPGGSTDHQPTELAGLGWHHWWVNVFLQNLKWKWNVARRQLMHVAVHSQIQSTYEMLKKSCWHQVLLIHTDCLWNSEFGDAHVAYLVKRFKPILQRAGVAVYQVEPQWTLLKDIFYRKWISCLVNWL